MAMGEGVVQALAQEQDSFLPPELGSCGLRDP
jgi:hypothetical protein